MLGYCSECMRFGAHHPSCPNAPDPKPVKICGRCEGEIYAGEMYHESEGGTLCVSCLEEMTGIEYVEFVGETIREAEEEMVLDWRVCVLRKETRNGK